jgi:Fe-coproporphyrin III synthase
VEAAIIVTYRCPMQCQMCNIWRNPTDSAQEFRPDLLNKLPRMAFANITGGEPTVREDLDEIVQAIQKKADRIVISSSGWFEDRILDLAKRFPSLGFRISIEGLSQKNDDLRGRSGGFDRGLRLLLGLRRMGIKDIGFGITISNHNSGDMLYLYELAHAMKLEFATAAFHNSFYFHKYDNSITNREEVVGNLEELVNRLLQERHPKSWFRAYFNMGLINYVQGSKRLLPCEAGTENFFLDPLGNVLPCNGMEEEKWFEPMGNLHDVADFPSLWNSRQAQHVRQSVSRCPKNCWMVGTVAPVMKKYLPHVVPWVAKNEIRSLLNRTISVHDMPCRWQPDAPVAGSASGE